VSGDAVAVFEGHTSWVHGVALSSNGDMISVGGDKSVRVWDLRMMCQRAALAGHQLRVWGVSCGTKQSEKGESVLAASCGSDQTVRLWDIGAAEAEGACGTETWKRERERSCVVLGNHDDGVLCVSLASDASVCVSGCEDGKVYCWRLNKARDERKEVGGDGLRLNTTEEAGRRDENGGDARQEAMLRMQISVLETEKGKLAAQLAATERRYNSELDRLRKELRDVVETAHRERSLSAAVSRQLAAKEEEVRVLHLRAMDSEMQCAELRSKLEAAEKRNIVSYTPIPASVASGPLVTSPSATASCVDSLDPLSGWVFSEPLCSPAHPREPERASLPDTVQMRGGAIPLSMLSGPHAEDNASKLAPISETSSVDRELVGLSLPSKDQARRAPAEDKAEVSQSRLTTSALSPVAVESDSNLHRNESTASDRMSERLKKLSSRLESLSARADHLTNSK